jgi:hypothetical protein
MRDLTDVEMQEVVGGGQIDCSGNHSSPNQVFERCRCVDPGEVIYVEGTSGGYRAFCAPPS